MRIKNEILTKEIDFIDATITRLDTQIQKGKDFCIAIWLGVLGFFLSEKFIELEHSKLYIAIALTALIPILFWVMDFYWRKALLTTSWRQKILSFHVNSKEAINDGTSFPLLDPVGLVYKKEDYPDYITNHKYFTPKPTSFDAFFYKEAKWFFPAMILFSVVLAVVYLCK